MPAVYPDLIKYEAYCNSAWVDISADVIDEESCKYGIFGNDQDERVASPGEMRMTLRNDSGCIGGVEGYYNPNFATALPGWNLNVPIRQTITFRTYSFIKRWYVLSINPGEVFDISVQVTCTDFMGYCSSEKIPLPAVEFDVDISDAVASILSAMTNSPATTSYGTGSVTFGTMFDFVSKKTTPLTEFAKIANSEFGYIYLKREEQLTVEGRVTRVIADRITYVPNPEDAFLLKEDGDFLLLETGDKILLDERMEASIENMMTSADSDHGSQMKNYISMTAYPRRVDSAATTVLFNLETSLSLQAGETKIYWAKYTDPSNEAEQVAGIDMVTPVATTHYLMNANSDGTGADLTGSLIVTATYFAQDVKYELENSGGTNGYVTFLQAVGKGVYTYSPVEYISEDSTSITAYGQKEFSLQMKYQENPDDVISLADKLLAQDKDPRENLRSITFPANKCATTMVMFVYLDIGDLVSVVEDTSGINGYYYINSINYTVKKGGFIEVTYGLIEALSFAETYWLLGDIGFSELDETTYLGY